MSYRIRTRTISKIVAVAVLTFCFTITAQANEVLPVVQSEVPNVVQDVSHISDSIITIRGVIVEDSTGEPYPFVGVRVLKDRKVLKGMKTVATGVTNFDGEFIIKVPQDTYIIEIACFGYLRDTIAETRYNADTMLAPIRLVADPNNNWESIEIDEHCVPIWDGEFFETNKFKKDGIQVKVR